MRPKPPYIYVETSLTRPTSITCAAWGGVKFKFIDAPPDVTALPEAEQIAALAALVLQHCIDMGGECPLFGFITGYRFVMSESVSIRLATDGTVVEHCGAFQPPFSVSLEIGGKAFKPSFTVSR
ncbi:MAG TPA: hypothetical protein VN442_08630 [Bryobacteraceae bacterium]|nr:hypothetical protein [Bryobacteraceae bacterium]